MRVCDIEVVVVISYRSMLYTWKRNAFGVLFLVEEFCSLWPVVLVSNCYDRRVYLYS